MGGATPPPGLGTVGVVVAAILGSAVAVAAVGCRVGEWLFPPAPPSRPVRCQWLLPPEGGGGTAVAPMAMAATTANPGEETGDRGSSGGGGADGVGN